MFKQADAEDVGGKGAEGEKVKTNIEVGPVSICKRPSSEFPNHCADGETKRARISVVHESLKRSGNQVCQSVMPQHTVEACVLSREQFGVNAIGNEATIGKPHEGGGNLPAACITSVRGKAPRSKILTNLTADVAEDRGARHTMEDAWVLLPQAWLGKPGKLRFAHFAIYDGHGGRHAAEYARAHLHANVLSTGLPRESMDIKRVRQAIMEGFKSTDEALLRESSAGGWQDGATAVCVWVLGQMVFVANVGDAKAVLARVNTKPEGVLNDSNTSTDLGKGAPLKGLIVTREHKAIFPQERARIQKAGGFVEGNGRLLGRLEVSRAFGDRNFKKAGVIAVPDIHIFELTERERFLILGCDGLWGVFGPSDAVEFVAKHLKDGVTVGMACKRLIHEAVRERKCKDNCTAVVIDFEHFENQS